MKIDKRTLFVRAWQIAKSASFERAGTVASEFFGESLKLAWVEARKPYSQEIEMTEKTWTGSEKQIAFAKRLVNDLCQNSWLGISRKDEHWQKMTEAIAAQKWEIAFDECNLFRSYQLQEKKINDCETAAQVIRCCQNEVMFGDGAQSVANKIILTYRNTPEEFKSACWKAACEKFERPALRIAKAELFPEA